MAIIRHPNPGEICPALSNENYEYHLSGDCTKFCICSVTDESCLGRYIHDPDDQTSQFFSRGVCSIDDERIKKCPMYGSSKEILAILIKERMEKELQKNLK